MFAVFSVVLMGNVCNVHLILCVNASAVMYEKSGVAILFLYHSFLLAVFADMVFDDDYVEECLHTLLKTDEDMAMLYLTHKRETGQAQPISDHQDV